MVAERTRHQESCSQWEGGVSSLVGMAADGFSNTGFIDSIDIYLESGPTEETVLYRVCNEKQKS